MRTHALLLNASLLAMHASGATAAQTSTTPSTQTLEEVIVTAERRATRLDRTPIAATVLSGEQLANNGVTAVDQLQFVTPATTVNNFGQGTNFNIRGIGKAETNSQTTTGVITYRDGVPSNPGWFTAEPYYDIRSIEVLRGPQGTFVGANATGGAVFITTNDPIVGGPLQGYLQGQSGTPAVVNCYRSAITTASAHRARSTFRSATRWRRASHSTATPATVSSASPVHTAATMGCASAAVGSAFCGSPMKISRCRGKPI